MKELITEIPNGAPPGGPYTPGIIAEGRFLFVSGQGPWCPERKCMVRGSIEEQTELTLANVKRVVEAAGGSLDNVVNVRVFLQPMTQENFQAMNGVYEKYFATGRPTRTTVGVSMVNIDVEIDCVVVL